MKVLLANKFHYRKGGSETYYFDLAESLREAGHEVVFFAMEGPDNEPCEQSRYFVSARDYNGKTSAVQKVKDATSLIYSNEAKEKFERLLQAERPDLIHLNLTHRQITFSILDAPSMAGIPVVYTAHDYIPVCPNAVMLDNDGNVCDECLSGSFMPCLLKKCVKASAAKSALAVMEADWLRRHKTYEKIDRIIAPSKFMREKLLEGGFPPEQVVVMQNFASQKLVEQARCGNDAPREKTILYSGRLSKEKGVDIAVAAFAAAIDFIPKDWRLLIAGDGPERAYVERLVANLGLGGRAEMLGHLDKEAIRAYAERASFAIASSKWRENMPYSIIEAFAAGTPVIGSRIGGIPELVLEGETGWLCEPGDVGSAALAICNAVTLDDPSYKLMSGCCQRYVIQRCAQSEYVSNLLSLYEELILDKSRCGA